MEYAVIHYNNDLLNIYIKEKLEKIIDEKIKTYEEYFCCDNEEQTCYFKGTQIECQQFVLQQDEEVRPFMVIKECIKNS